MFARLLPLRALAFLMALAFLGASPAQNDQETSPSQQQQAPSQADLALQPRIQISLSTSQPSYRIGEQVVVDFSVGQDSYLYLFSTDSRGATRQIFPNRFDQNNYLQAGQRYRVPVPGDGYTLIASGPAGQDVLEAVATSEMYPWVAREYGGAGEEAGSEAFPIRRESPAQFARRLGQSVQESRAAMRPRERITLPGEVDREDPESNYRPAPSLDGETAAPPPTVGYQRLVVPIYDSGTRPPTGYQPNRPTYRPPYNAYPTPVPPQQPYYPPQQPPYGGGGYYPPYGGGGYNPYYPPPADYPPYGYPPRPPLPSDPDDIAQLRVSSSPDGAEVFIDRVYYGRTPLTVPLPEGRYDVEIVARGYRSSRQTVRLEEGSSESISVRLRR